MADDAVDEAAAAAEAAVDAIRSSYGQQFDWARLPKELESRGWRFCG